MIKRREPSIFLPKSPGELSTPPEAAGWGGARRVHPISGTAANSYSITASPRSDVDFSQKLMDPMSRKAISSVPKLANRAPFAFVVDPFLVRTADYAVGHRDR